MSADGAGESDFGDLEFSGSAGDAMRLARPIRALSLTGGGYRGLFTSRVLVELCARAQSTGPLTDAVDVFAGTSIGGLMACALAVGMPPQRVLDCIDRHAPEIFPAKRLKEARRNLVGPIYDSAKLAGAIKDCLGPNQALQLKDLDRGLVVPAVDWLAGKVRVYRSAWFGAARASHETLFEVCMATSAAPTFFEPALVDGFPMLDGGLAVNNPDLLVVLEVIARDAADLERLELLGIGTAAVSKARVPEDANRSGAGWVPDIATFLIDLQERSAADQAQQLLGARYLRLDRQGAASDAFEHLDMVNDDNRTMLMHAGVRVAETAFQAPSSRSFVHRFFRGHAPLPPSPRAAY